jgi:hypothetical protein
MQWVEMAKMNNFVMPINNKYHCASFVSRLFRSDVVDALFPTCLPFT